MYVCMYKHAGSQAAGHVEDHFCQTWSLLIAIELSHLKPAAKAQAARTRTGRGDGDDGGGGFVFCPGGPGLTHILRFLRRILTIDTIAECAYDEIYHRTHTANDGQRHYGAVPHTYIHTYRFTQLSNPNQTNTLTDLHSLKYT